VNSDCREKMVLWLYQIADFCKFNRESVAMAMCYLDRFLLTEYGIPALRDTNIFQLAAMTALYTAIKVHEPEAMDPHLVTTLSRGAYTIEEVEAMERTLLEAIGWRVNTPTSLAFVRFFLELLPTHVLDNAEKEAAYDLATFQTEMAVRDYKFVIANASTVAFASVMNSVESVCDHPEKRQYIRLNLSRVAQINADREEVLDIQRHLYRAMSEQNILGSFAFSTIVNDDKPSNKSARTLSRQDSPCSLFDLEEREESN